MDIKDGNPLFTIIVAVLNSKESLERCIESVNNQTYPYKELIVKSSDFDAAGINRMLIMNGVDVKEINPAQTLEDLYMQVTEYALESR